MILKYYCEEVKLSTMTLQNHCDEVKSILTLQDHCDSNKINSEHWGVIK